MSEVYPEIGHIGSRAYPATPVGSPPASPPPWECPNHPGTWVITGGCLACQRGIAVAPPATVAPELAAAMAETRQVRDGYAALCGEFGPSAQSGWSARISLTVLNRHRAAAGLEAFSRTESNQREDITMRYRRERDEARVQLADVQHAAGEWVRETVARETAGLAAERDAHKLRADHYEGLWRAEHGLPSEGGVTGTAP